MTFKRAHDVRLPMLVAAAAMSILAGCSPPQARRAERIQFKPAVLDVDSLRINQKATMAFVEVEAAIVDERSLDRVFGRKHRTRFPRVSRSGKERRPLDVYLVSVVRIDPSFGEHLLYVDAEIAKPEALRGRRVRFSGGAAHLGLDDAVYSVTKVADLSLSLDTHRREDPDKLLEQIQASDVKLRVVDVFKK